MFSAHLKTIQKLLNSLAPQNLQTKLHIKSSHIVYSHHVSLGDILWSIMVPVFLWLNNFVEYLLYMSFSWCFLIIWFRYTYLPGKFRRELYCFQCILTRGSWCVTLQGRLTLISQLGWHPHFWHVPIIWSLGWEDPLEEGIATHSSILAWRIPMDKGASRATVHGVTKSQTWLKRLSMHTHHSLSSSLISGPVRNSKLLVSLLCFSPLINNFSNNVL